MIKIYDKNLLLGIKINKIKTGSIPITNSSEFVQIVTLKHDKGSYLKAHTHKPKKRVTQKLQECMVVVKGEIKLDLYNLKNKLVRHITIKAGQAFLILNGGVGVHIKKDAEIIEIKNGPFIEDKELI